MNKKLFYLFVIGIFEASILISCSSTEASSKKNTPWSRQTGQQSDPQPSLRYSYPNENSVDQFGQPRPLGY
jgi:hypothetical protein